MNVQKGRNCHDVLWARYRYRVHGEINRKVLGKWCKQILKALCFLHELTPAVAHGDIRCDNIFIIGETGNVKVGNFCLIQPPQEDSLLGTFGKTVSPVPPVVAFETRCAAARYTPPENTRDTPAGDIYCFGMTLLEIVTKSVPYEEVTSVAEVQYLKQNVGD
jgi:WNK lysine deficient protein kinase